MDFSNIIEFNAFINNIISEFKIKFYHTEEDFNEEYYILNALFKALMLFEIRDYYNIECDSEVKQSIIKEINNILDHGVTKNYYNDGTYWFLSKLYSYRYQDFETLTRLQKNVEFNRIKTEAPASFYILIFSLYLKSLYSLNQNLVNTRQNIFIKILSDFDSLVPSKIFIKMNCEMNNAKIIYNCLLNILLGIPSFDYSAVCNNSFYLGSSLTQADFSINVLSNGDIVNPIFIDNNTNKSRTFWFVSNEMVIQNGELIDNRPGLCNIYTVKAGEVPKFSYISDVESDTKKKEIVLNIPTNIKEKSNKKLFKSLLPVQKKFIPLYLLEKQLGGKINDTYIFGDIVRGSKIRFDGDKNIIIRDRIVPEIQYFNNTGKGKLY